MSHLLKHINYFQATSNMLVSSLASEHNLDRRMEIGKAEELVNEVNRLEESVNELQQRIAHIKYQVSYI